jgi:hypothetical protein
MLPRRRGARPTWPLDLAEPAAGNYYPLTSAAALLGARPAPSAAGAGAAAAAGSQEEAARGGSPLALTLATDRAQGAASLADGQLEVMLHRWGRARSAGAPLGLFCATHASKRRG